MKNSNVDIFQFTSYREFLRAVADSWLNAGKTWRDLSEFSGFSSPNFMQQIINGKRNLTLQAAKKFATHFQATAAEHQYLDCMISLSKARDQKDVNQLLNKMKRLVGQAKKRSVKDNSIFDHWLYGVVFEMFKTKQIKTLDNLIKTPLRITASTNQRIQAYEFLVQKGYLSLDGTNISPAEVEFLPQNDARRINSQQNHLKFLAMAQHRIHDNLSDREFQGLTFTVHEGRMQSLKNEIRMFIKKINDDYAEDADGDQVVRLQMSLFKILQ